MSQNTITLERDPEKRQALDQIAIRQADAGHFATETEATMRQIV